MSRDNLDLREAMAKEREILEPIVYAADLVIDTSRMGVHELREIVHQRLEQRTHGPAVDHVRILRLQARHPRRCGFRVRRALDPESRTGSRRCASSRGAMRKW